MGGAAFALGRTSGRLRCINPEAHRRDGKQEIKKRKGAPGKERASNTETEK